MSDSARPLMHLIKRISLNFVKCAKISLYVIFSIVKEFGKELV